MNKLKLLSVLISLISVSIAKGATSAYPDTSQVKDLPIKLVLPNDHWHLVVDNPTQIIFKRDAITDSNGRSIVPAIMLVSSDASSYKQDVTIFCSQKMAPFLDRGVKVDRIINWQQKEYPLQFKNALFMRGEYVDHDVPHIIYMIYAIDRHDKGIQVYMDMTKDIAPQYEPEFIKTIRSLQLQP